MTDKKTLPKNNRTVTPLRVLMLLVVLVGVYFLLPQLGSFKDTFSVLQHALWWWVIIGFIASLLTFLAGAIMQFGAGDLSGKLSDILLLQFAGSFVNHFLPFSVGGIHLNGRYYQKLGKKQAQAITMSTTPIVFAIAVTVLIVAIISPITLVQLVSSLHLKRLNVWLVLAVILALLIFLVVMFKKFKSRVGTLFKEALDGIKVISGRKPLLLLIAGSLAIAILSTVALLTSILAVHATMGVLGVFIIYVSASVVSELAPTPGGIGATEAVLILALAAAGLRLPQAVAVTLIFRLVTFWLPMIPGGWALHQVNRRKIL